MSSTHAPHPLAWPPLKAGWRPHPLASMSARLRSARIDRELAAGVAPWHSPAYAARSLQLTSHHSRRSLAGSLERLIERAEHPRASFQSAAIPPCREQVSPARPMLRELALRLRSGEPLAAGGVASLRALLCDGAGPLFVPSHPGALASALENVFECLTAPD